MRSIVDSGERGRKRVGRGPEKGFRTLKAAGVLHRILLHPVWQTEALSEGDSPVDNVADYRIRTTFIYDGAGHLLEEATEVDLDANGSI